MGTEGRSWDTRIAVLPLVENATIAFELDIVATYTQKNIHNKNRESMKR